MKDNSIGETIVIEKDGLKIQEPSLYYVIFLNDDYTAMEFVKWLLIKYFNKDEDEAELITQKIHINGKGLAGIYSKEIAETKIYEVEKISRLNDYPLVLIMEKCE